jgi:secondary thiamine-phosphate synthase enzyme
MLAMNVTRIYRETLSTTEEMEVSTSDLTGQIKEVVARSKINNGLVHVFSVGSTGAIISIEFEEGLLQDLKETLRRLVPRDLNYRHRRAWQDDNAHSHLRATLLGPQLMAPVTDGKAELGQWQQIVVVNLDNQPRERKIIVTVFGD